jgi:hypothetical protein
MVTLRRVYASSPERENTGECRVVRLTFQAACWWSPEPDVRTYSICVIRKPRYRYCQFKCVPLLIRLSPWACNVVLLVMGRRNWYGGTHGPHYRGMTCLPGHQGMVKPIKMILVVDGAKMEQSPGDDYQDIVHTRDCARPALNDCALIA